MVDAAINAGTPTAAPPATDEADLAMLSRMAGLAEEMAAGFQARAMAALEAGDLDRAGAAETHFDTLFLGIRRAIALKARLRRQREEAQRQAAAHRDRRQGEKDRRRQAVARGVSRAVAVVDPAAQERLTADLWEKLTENDRIDADLADTVLPVEALIRRLGREIGLADSAIAYGLDPKGTPDPAAAGPKASGGPPFVPPAGYALIPDPEEEDSTESRHICCISAADLGLPGDESYRVRIDTGEVFDNIDDDDDDVVIMRLPVPDHPWRADAPDVIRRSARAMAAERAVPPEPRPPPLDPEEAEFQRQAAYAKQHGITLVMPPALRERLDMLRRESAGGGARNRRATGKRP